MKRKITQVSPRQQMEAEIRHYLRLEETEVRELADAVEAAKARGDSNTSYMHVSAKLWNNDCECSDCRPDLRGAFKVYGR